MKVSVLTLSIATVLCLAAVPTNAAIIAQTGFESPEYTTSMSADAAGQGAGESGWTTGWVDVYDSNSDIQTAIVNGGSQALQINSYGIPTTANSAGPGNMYSPRASYRRFVDRISGSSVISLSFDMYVDTWGDQGPGLLYMRDDNNMNGPTLIFEQGTGNLIAYNDGTSPIDTGFDLAEDTWHNIEIVADYGSRTYQVLIDSNDAGTYNFRDVDTEGFAYLEFFQQLNSSVYYDNVVLSSVVPEPSTIALLGAMGLVGVVAYRRKSA